MEAKKKYSLVLELGSGKYWVAETGNPKAYQQNCEEGKCNTEYIKTYGYKSVIETHEGTCKGIIHSMMRKYGVNNVRGTCYPKESLTSDQKREVNAYLEKPLSFATPLMSSSTKLDLSPVGTNIASFFAAQSYPGHDMNTPVEPGLENILSNILLCQRKTLYILRLKRNKFYVGTTTKPIEERIREHREGRGSWFTRAHPVEECIYSGPVLTNFDEDNMTEALMFALGSSGVDRVRGGSYSQFVINSAQREVLQQKFDHLRNACLSCGEKGHYAAEYPHPQGELCNRCHTRGHNEVLCTYRYLKL